MKTVSQQYKEEQMRERIKEGAKENGEELTTEDLDRLVELAMDLFYK